MGNPFVFKNGKSILDLNPQERRLFIFKVSFAILIITFIFTGIQSLIAPEEVTMQSASDYGVGKLGYGESIVLRSEDIGECRDIDKSDGLTCNAFNSNQHFKPGLYTIIYSPINYPENVSPKPSLSLNLNLDDYLEFEKTNEHETDYFRLFPQLDSSFKIENVPLQDNAYIVFESMPKGMTFTVELVSQTQYSIFKNNSDAIGFYPVDIAISQGKYKLETDDSNCIDEDKADAHIENYTTNDDFITYLCDEDKFNLNAGEMLVSYNPNMKLKQL